MPTVMATLNQMQPTVESDLFRLSLEQRHRHDYRYEAWLNRMVEVEPTRLPTVKKSETI